ncbi:MAG TPA: DUF2652 domain-containing protein [Candidatus Dormibacteraeota bacterium]|nr:DUF2652 domain-containing protein [Candidatus Dormibacteraeota bacterium]
MSQPGAPGPVAPKSIPEVSGVLGPLVLVDISGYTTYVAETELTHSQILVGELLDAVLQSLGAHLEVSSVEGDAVFFVGDSIGPELMAWLDETYIAFHRRLRSVVAERAVNCSCQACVRAPMLTVKVIAHHGHYTRFRVGQVEQLHGTDVIVPHRLAKNHVPSHEYVLATAMLLDLLPREQAAAFTRVYEEVADLGLMAVGYRDFAPLRAQLG